ncbi:hypothetical protein VNO78_03479 [Psophocarpus tetragonolobus]|uniref:Uncharacterized protein n=1 Tax=Psophocarpus tetragonolobus TaxID=3891 RepID=A0AAN9T4A5_PSOTE
MFYCSYLNGIVLLSHFVVKPSINIHNFDAWMALAGYTNLCSKDVLTATGGPCKLDFKGQIVRSIEKRHVADKVGLHACDFTYGPCNLAGAAKDQRPKTKVVSFLDDDQISAGFVLHLRPCHSDPRGRPN